MAIRCESLSYYVGARKPWKCLLENVNVSFSPAEVSVIMGPSGAGKSTLLDLIAQRKNYGHLHGSIVIDANGVGYVMQSDVHISSFTVHQNLEFAARLRSPKKLGRWECDTMVKQAAIAVDIFVCIHTIVGDSFTKGISGGQKRRLSIAIELLNTPEALCLDEPTSGLDSSTASAVVVTMKKLAHDEGRTIIATIHQPSAETFQKFDKLILLSRGQLIYQGSAATVKQYFEQLGYFCPAEMNPADFVIEVASGQHSVQGHEIEALAKIVRPSTSMYAEKTPENGYSFKNPEEFNKVRSFPLMTLVQRGFLLSITNIYGFRMTVGRFVGMGTLMGLIYINKGRKVHEDPLIDEYGVISDNAYNVCALLFLLTTFSLLSNAVAVPDMYQLKQLYDREVSAKLYGPISYILALVIVNTPIFIIAMTLHCVIVRELVGFAGDWGYLIVTMILSGLLGYFQAQCAAAAASSAAISFVLFVMLSIPSILLAGFLIFVPDLVEEWKYVAYVPYTRWAYQLLIKNTFVGETDSTSLLDLFGFNDQSRSICLLILFMYCIVFQVFLWLALKPGRSHLEILELLPDPTACQSPVEEKSAHKPQDNRSSLEVNLLKADNLMSPPEVDGPSGISFSANTEETTRSIVLLTVPTEEQTLIQFFGISCAIKKKTLTKHIVKDVWGEVKPGESCAIMGPSGSGKTTLLDILAGRKRIGALLGRVVVNGRVLDIQHNQKLRNYVYVMQDDAFNPYLSVREALEYAARLRLGGKVENDALQMQVDTLLNLLELSKVKKTIVGPPQARQISGGQARRLTIGVEICSGFSLVFLDEPTSGLDSHLAQQVVDLLTVIASTSRTIICTIHQPSERMFTAFSKVLLLSQGRVIYFGSPTDVTRHFETLGYACVAENPADFIMDVATCKITRTGEAGEQIAPMIPDQLANKYWTSVQGDLHKDLFEGLRQRYGGPDAPKYDSEAYVHTTLSLSKQLSLMLGRQLKAISRQPTFIIALYVRSAVTALLLGTIFYDASSYTTIISAYAGCFITTSLCISDLIPLLHEDRLLFYRERAAGVISVVPYWACLSVEYIVLMAGYTLVFCSIVYPLVGLRPATEYFLFFWVVIFSGNLTVLYIVHLAMAVTSTAEMTAAIFPGISIPLFILFSGLPLLISTMQAWYVWVAYIDPMRWTLEALFVNEFKGNQDACQNSSYDQLSDLYDYGLNKGASLAIILSLGAFFKLAQLRALKKINFESR